MGRNSICGFNEALKMGGQEPIEILIQENYWMLSLLIYKAK
jgi:hypothetical protein